MTKEPSSDYSLDGKRKKVKPVVNHSNIVNVNINHMNEFLTAMVIKKTKEAKE